MHPPARKHASLIQRLKNRDGGHGLASIIHVTENKYIQKYQLHFTPIDFIISIHIITITITIGSMQPFKTNVIISVRSISGFTTLSEQPFPQ